MSKGKKKEDSSQDMIEHVVNLLREHPHVKALFARFEVPLDSIHDIPIEFDAIDTSAKAKKGKIILNKKLAEDGDFIEDLHYIIHELTHVLQQQTGAVYDHGDLNDYDYLDNPLEIDAFKEQIAFIAQYKGPEEAHKYLEHLLDFHDFEGASREHKKRQLRGETDAMRVASS
jgi:hypothetical protein